MRAGPSGPSGRQSLPRDRRTRGREQRRSGSARRRWRGRRPSRARARRRRRGRLEARRSAVRKTATIRGGWPSVDTAASSFNSTGSAESRSASAGLEASTRASTGSRPAASAASTRSSPSQANRPSRSRPLLACKRRRSLSRGFVAEVIISGRRGSCRPGDSPDRRSGEPCFAVSPCASGERRSDGRHEAETQAEAEAERQSDRSIGIVVRGGPGRARGRCRGLRRSRRLGGRAGRGDRLGSKVCVRAHSATGKPSFTATLQEPAVGNTTEATYTPSSGFESVAGNVRSSPVAAFATMTDGVASTIGVCPCCKTWMFAVHVSPAATSGCGLTRPSPCNRRSPFPRRRGRYPPPRATLPTASVPPLVACTGLSAEATRTSRLGGPGRSGFAGRLRSGPYEFSAAFARSAIFAKAAGSWTARSASTLRSSSIFGLAAGPPRTGCRRGPAPVRRR